MAAVAVAMLLWGVDKLFYKLPSSGYNAIYKSTQQDDAIRIFNHLIQTHHPKGSALPTQHELKQYEQIALHQASIQQSKKQYINKLQMYLHPQILKDLAKHSGIDTNSAKEVRNQTQLRAHVEFLHQQVRQHIIDEALQNSYIDDKNAHILAQRINAKKKFSWIELPIENSNKYTPTAKEIEDLYNKTPFPQADEMQIDYIKIPVNKKTNHLSDEISDQVLFNPNNLEAIAKHYKTSVRTSGVFTLEKGTKDITNHKEVRQVANTLSTKNAKVSDPITVDKSIVIMRKKMHKLGEKKPLNLVKKSLIQTIQTEKSLSQQNTISQQIVSDITSGKHDFNSIAKTHNTTLHSSALDEKSSLDDEVPTPILNHGFSIETEHSTPFRLLSEDKNTWIIYQIDRVEDNNTTPPSNYEELSKSQLLQQELIKVYNIVQ